MPREAIRVRCQHRSGRPQTLDLHVAMVPYFSILAMLSDSVAGLRRGLPAGLRRRIGGAVRGTNRAAVAPIGTPGQSILPDCVVPLVPRSDLDWRAGCGAHAGYRAGRDRRVHRTRIRRPDPAALGGRRRTNPRRWMSRLPTRSSISAATVIDPLLARASPLFDREIDRVGRAVVHDGVDVLLSTLTHAWRLTAAHWASTTPVGALQLGQRRLVLVPLVGGERILLSNVDCPDVVWVGYPVPGCEQLWHGRSADTRTIRWFCCWANRGR